MFNFLSWLFDLFMLHSSDRCGSMFVPCKATGILFWFVRGGAPSAGYLRGWLVWVDAVGVLWVVTVCALNIVGFCWMLVLLFLFFIDVPG